MNIVDLFHHFAPDVQFGTTLSIGGAALAAIWGIVKNHKKNALVMAKDLALIFVREIQQTVGAQLTGPEKKAEAKARMKKALPRLPDWLADSFIEAAVYLLKVEEEKAKAPTVVLPLTPPAP